jgi:hypothetical protein
LKASYRKEVSFSKKDLLDLWEKQNKRCPLTGWQMTTLRNRGVIQTNVSIDRINPDLGYTIENIQLVCVVVNKAKWDLQQEEFIDLCRAVSKHAGERHV